MATIAQTSMRSNGAATVTTTTSNVSDTFAYVPGTFQMLQIRNTTAGSLDVTIDGAGATTISPPGYGGTINIATGKVISVGANATVNVPLDSISSYLQGVIAVTNTGTPGQLVYSLLGL